MRVDIYKVIDSKEAYYIKERFIRKGVEEGKSRVEIVEGWLEILNKYNLKEDYEWGLKPYTSKKSIPYPNLSYYKTIDAEGEILDDNLKATGVPWGFKREDSSLKLGKNINERFRGVVLKQQKLDNGYVGSLEVHIVDEMLGTHRVKTYQTRQKKEHVIADFIFYMDDKNIPEGKEGTVAGIYREAVKRKEEHKKQEQVG